MKRLLFLFLLAGCISIPQLDPKDQLSPREKEIFHPDAPPSDGDSSGPGIVRAAAKPVPLKSTVLLVDYITGSDTNDGITAPLKYVQTAVSIALPGDTIRLASDAYPPQGRNFVLDATGKKDVQIDGAGFAMLGCPTWAIVLRGCERVKIKSVACKGSGIFMRAGCKNCTVKDVTVSDAPTLRAFLLDDSQDSGTVASDRNAFKRCTATRTYIGFVAGNHIPNKPMPTRTLYEDCAAIDIIGGPNGDGYQALGIGTTATYTRCTAIRCDDDGWDVGNGASCVIEHFTITDCGRNGDGAGVKLGTYESDMQPGGPWTLRYGTISGTKYPVFADGWYRAGQWETNPAPVLTMLHVRCEPGSAGDTVMLEGAEMVATGSHFAAPTDSRFASVRHRLNGKAKLTCCSLLGPWRDAEGRTLPIPSDCVAGQSAPCAGNHDGECGGVSGWED